MQHKTTFEENDLALLSVKDHIATITLNRPKQYNAFNDEYDDEFKDEFESLDDIDFDHY